MFSQKRLYQKLYLQSLRETINIQEQEREKIAQELHDEISSILAAAKMKIAFLPEIWNNYTLRKISIDESKKLLEMSLHQIRDLSHELSPSHLTTFGLEESLKYFFEQSKGYININFTYNVKTCLTHEQQLVFYRIILELFHNTLKHAQASKIDIFLSEEYNSLILQYSGNGQGLPSITIKDKKGWGLKNIENRVNTLKGKLFFENSSNGFSIKINIPITVSLK